MVAFHMMHQGARKTLFPLTREKRIGTLVMFAVRSIFAKPERVVAAMRGAAAKGEVEQVRLATALRRSTFCCIAAAPPTSPRPPIASPATSRASTWCCSAPAMPRTCAPMSRRCSSRRCPQADREKLAPLFGHLTDVGMDAAPDADAVVVHGQRCPPIGVSPQ